MRLLPPALIPACLACLVSLLLAAAGPALAGTAEVQFEHPERFSDAGRGSAAEDTRRNLTDIFGALAAEGLPAGQVLTVVVTDVDLAGEIPPGSVRLHDVRVMGRHVDWPRISLRYTLQEGDRTLAQGSEVVSDMAYLQHGMLLSNHQPLPYERRMLADWFARQFRAPTGR